MGERLAAFGSIRYDFLGRIRYCWNRGMQIGATQGSCILKEAVAGALRRRSGRCFQHYADQMYCLADMADYHRSIALDRLLRPMHALFGEIPQKKNKKKF